MISFISRAIANFLLIFLTKQWVFEGALFNSATVTLVAMMTSIWDSISNNEIIIVLTAKGLDRHRVRENIAYLVVTEVTYHTVSDRDLLADDFVVSSVLLESRSLVTHTHNNIINKKAELSQR